MFEFLIKILWNVFADINGNELGLVRVEWRRSRESLRVIKYWSKWANIVAIRPRDLLDNRWDFLSKSNKVSNPQGWVTWTSWHLNSPTTRLFLQQILQGNNDGTSKPRITSPFVWVIRRWWWIPSTNMMSSLNGSSFRVTGPLWGESTVIGGFPSWRASNAGFNVFFNFSLNRRSNKQSSRR